MKKTGFFLAVVFCIGIFNTPTAAQVPILYYDFENNATRSTFENAIEQTVNSGSGALTRSRSITISGVAGAGTFNGGSATGQAISTSGWENNANDPGTSALDYFQFVINTNGFSGVFITFDCQSSATGPGNVGILYSTDGVSFTELSVQTTGTLGSFNARTFDLSAISSINNQSTVTIRVYGYKGGNASFSSGGTFRIDNLTVLARTVTASETLLDFPAIGLSIKSGTAFTPTYADFTVNGSGITVALASNLNINGTLALTSGALSIGANTLTLNGDISTTSGTLTGGSTSNITFGGSGASTALPTVTINNLTINRANGISLGGSIIVDGTLALTSGDITTGSFTLFMGFNAPNSTGTGDVVGNVNRSDLNGGTTRSFGNPFVQITETAGSVNTITVNLTKGSTPSDFLNSVKRVYTITVNNGTNLAATVQLHYLDSELNGNIDESMLQLWRKDDTLGWQAKGKDLSGGNDASNNWVKLSGVTQFSPWTISGPNAPTAVEMMGFNAVSDESGNVLLEWQTGTEVNNLGFNIYREQAGRREKVNPTLVAGSVPLAGRTVMTAGIAYAWVDKLASAKEEAVYWLEDVDLDGTTTLHGPVSVLPVGKFPARADSLLLSQLNASAANADAVRILRPGSAASDSAARVRLSSGDLQKQWEIAAKAGAKILISKAGWYRITQPQLVAAGFDVAKDPRFLQLFTDAQEVPLIVSGGASGRLEPKDFIEFYAQGLDTPSTNRRAYYLTNGSLTGRRIPVVAVGKGRETRSRSFTSTLERRDRFLYFPSINNGDAENWFGAIVSQTPFNQALSVAKLNQEAADDALLEVALQGLGSATGPEHAVRLQLNGQDLGSMSFTGQQHQVAQFHISQRMLLEGSNQLTFTSQGSSDFSVIDSVKLSYAHRFVADQNSLLLSASGGEMVQVSGFTTQGVRVFDITDEMYPIELKGLVEADGKSYRVTVAAQEAGERVLLAISDKGYGQGAQVIAQTPSSWHEPRQGADVLMITHSSLRAALDPLVSLRKEQGYAVAVVDIEDLYDEYSYGQHTAQAIAEFIAATRSWKRAPRWVLLVGDASYDGKNYLGLGENDLVPTKVMWTNTFETASDEWLADVNGDGLADVAVGRLPVRTLAQAQAMVGKIVSYPSNPTDGALLVADRNDGFDFEAATGTVKSLLPTDMRTEQVIRSQMDDATANRAIIDAINRGPKLVNYAGHGSASVWRGNLLTNDSIPLLTNQQALPVVVSMTCLNGLFNDPRSNSLGESLLLSERGGAIAVWASSAQTVAYGQAQINQELIRQLFQGTSGKNQSLTLGEAVSRAKAAVSDSDVRRSWILLGDPMLRLR